MNAQVICCIIIIIILPVFFNMTHKLRLPRNILENIQTMTEWEIELYEFLKIQKTTLHYQCAKRIQINIKIS